MHPRIATLIAFCDGEAGVARSRRMERHLSKCEKCRGRLWLIRREKDELAATSARPVADARQGLAGLLSAVAAWRGDRTDGAARELKSRLRCQIETYCGSAAIPVVERPGMRAEELLGKTSEILETFLGPEAAEAVRNDVLSGLDWTEPAGEMRA